MKIYFAGDHAGFEMKQKLMEFVRGLGHEVEDLGPYAYDANDDYPDYVIPLARLVAEKAEKRGKKGKMGERGEPGKRSDLRAGEKGERGERGEEIRGIIVAGSGQGEIIAMNRVKDARAALFCPCNLELVKASRAHNDSNIFCIGARFCTLEEAKKGIAVWLETPFSNDERHIRRLRKIDAL